jgi:hypothetical protein
MKQVKSVAKAAPQPKRVSAPAVKTETKLASKKRDNRKVFDLSELQMRLAKLPLYSEKPDGLFGNETRQAIQAALVTCGVDSWRKWSDQRLQLAGQQAVCSIDGIETGTIDGLAGPQTRHALEVYEARLNGDTSPENWRDPAEDKPAQTAPPTKAQTWPLQKDCIKYFGKPGQNQTRLTFPFPMKLAWDTDTIVRSTLCHEKIHDAASRIFTRVLDHYGEAEVRSLGLDLFGGCLNVRKMRGGSAWSMHSWGIAFDFDPARNQLRWGKDKAVFAKPAYEKWLDLWEEEGAISLGRSRNYDWMHVQFARL